MVQISLALTGGKPGPIGGQTTALAFGLMADAMRSPFKWHLISDHRDNKSLVLAINEIISTLKYKYFVFKVEDDEWFISFGDPESFNDNHL